MNKIAIAFPTYEASDSLYRIISNEKDLWQKYNVDIYIYDSSTDDLTKDILEDNKFFHYYKFDKNVNSGEKVFKLYEELHNKYDYIWMRRDGHTFEENILEYIFEVVTGTDSDAIIIYDDKLDSQMKPETIELNNTIDIFKMFFWKLTLFGAVVLRCNSVLSSTDWVYMRGKYLTADKYNFSHVGLYFEQFAKIDKPHYKALYLPSGARINTKKDKLSLWVQNGEGIRIWSECICVVLDSLPEYYLRNKLDVQIATTTLPRRFEKNNMLLYRVADEYTLAEWNKYQKWLYRVSSLNNDELERIAKLSGNQAFDEFLTGIYNEILPLINRSKKVYLYGAGKIGKAFAELLDKKGCKYNGFVTSDFSGLTTLLNHPVFIYDQIREEKGIGFIITMGEKIANVVINKLIKDGFDKSFKYLNIPAIIYSNDKIKKIIGKNYERNI